MTHSPVEHFPVLDEFPFVRAAFLCRTPGVDVKTDRETALSRLAAIHRETADAAGFSGMPFATAEQVHGQEIAVVSHHGPSSHPAVDGLVTSLRGVCLAIYVADCAAVYLVDRKARAIGLVHSGKKGTELNIVGHAIATMNRELSCDPSDIVVQLGPCIRPPHYEVDIASRIAIQAAEAGAGEVHDCGKCTASDPESYYSYRREKGRTGRLLALLALSY